MKLKDIYLGSIDAKNELLTDSPAERARFSSAFVIPPSLDLSKYIKRERYFVLGLKGTGKTALLRYISIKTEEATNNKSDFILFKSDIDEDFRKSFTQAARVTSDSANSNIEENFVDNNSSEFQGVL